ncbi:MAG: hypothetical protein NC413_03270, partial [Muribaculum sp.]|nr:hypothetical protein [Muribaculum sp.]
MDEVKHFYTDLINTLVKDDKDKLHVFDEKGLYLATNEDKKYSPNIFGRTTRKRNRYGRITSTVCAGTVSVDKPN